MVGSSYISGAENCVAITLDENDELKPLNTSEHPSGIVFEDIVRKNGEDTTMPKHDNLENRSGYMTGNEDDGYIIITRLEV